MYNPLFESLLSKAKEYKPIGIYEDKESSEIAKRYVYETIFSTYFKYVFNLSIGCPNVVLKDNFVKIVGDDVINFNPATVDKGMQDLFALWGKIYTKFKEKKISDRLTDGYNKADQGLKKLEEAYELCKKRFSETDINSPDTLNLIKSAVEIYKQEMQKAKK